MFGFERFFGGNEAPKAEQPNKLKDEALDKEAAAFLAQLDKQGISDKGVKIESFEGQSTTEKREGGFVERPTYLSGRKGA